MRHRRRTLCHDERGTALRRMSSCSSRISGGSFDHSSRIKHDPRRKSLGACRLSADEVQQRIQRSFSAIEDHGAPSRSRRAWRPIDTLRRSLTGGAGARDEQDGDCMVDDRREPKRKSIVKEHSSFDDIRHSASDPHPGQSRPQRKWSRPIDSLRRSLKGAGAGDENAEHYDAHADSTSVTLSSHSGASRDSSCFDASECKEARKGKRSIPPIKHIQWSASCGDGYSFETDQAVVCKVNGLTSTLAKNGQQPIDETQRHVQQIVDQLLHEQTLAAEAWDEVATEYYKRIEPFTSMFVPQLLDRKCLASGDVQSKKGFYYLEGKSVLDVAAGTGAGAIYAKSRGASSVMATDFSEEMLRVLRQRIEAYPCRNIGVDTLVANGLCLPFYWSNTYDVVFSNFGVIYFPKVKEGLREMVRCAKPGGKVCISGWGSKEETHAFSVFPTAMKRCGFNKKWYRAQSSARKHLLALSGTVPLSSSEQQPRQKSRYHGVSLTPNYFCPTTRVSSSQYYLRSLMEEAGLKDVRVIPVTNELRLDCAESYWNRFVLASPNLKRFVEHCLSPDEVSQLKEAVSEIILEDSRDDGSGVAMKASAYIAIGTKKGLFWC